MIIRRELPADSETLRQLFSEVYSDTMFDALHNYRDARYQRGGHSVSSTVTRVSDPNG